jgi:hypothetical protein
MPLKKLLTESTYKGNLVLTVESYLATARMMLNISREWSTEKADRANSVS